MAAGNEKGRPGGWPRRLPLVLFDLGVIHGRWCFAALEMCLGVFLGERRVGRQADVDRAFLIERATVEPDGLGRLAVRHVQDQVGIEECPRGKRDLVSACRLFLRNQDNLDARSRKRELSSVFSVRPCHGAGPFLECEGPPDAGTPERPAPVCATIPRPGHLRTRGNALTFYRALSPISRRQAPVRLRAWPSLG